VIVSHSDTNRRAVRVFAGGLVWKSGRMVWNGICAKYGVQIV